MSSRKVALAGAGGWTVSKGGHYTATNSTASDRYVNITAGITIKCPRQDVKAEGNIFSGNRPNGTSIGNISHYSPGYSPKAIGGHSCFGPLGAAVTGKNLTTFHINAISQPKASVTNVTITNIGIKFNAQIGNNTCVFAVQSTPARSGAKGKYTNTTGVLSVFTANLSVVAVNSKCFGMIKSGNHMSFSGPLTIKNGSGGHPQIKDP